MSAVSRCGKNRRTAYPHPLGGYEAAAVLRFLFMGGSLGGGSFHACKT